MGVDLPFWSPDGRHIGFFAQGKLKKTDASGGVPQTLCDAPASEGGTWSREGVILFSQPRGALLRVSDGGGQATPVTTLDPSTQQIAHLSPQFLPDGRSFVYLSQSSVAENSGIFVGSLDDKTTSLLVRSPVRAAYASGYLLFMRLTGGPAAGPSGTLMAQAFDLRRMTLASEAVPVAEQVATIQRAGAAGFAVSESGALAYRTGRGGGETQFVWLDRRGTSLETAGKPGGYRTHDLSPDERRIAAHRHDDDKGNIWIIEPARDITTRLTLTDTHDYAPIWSPDGGRIVFASVREGAVADLY